MYIYHANAPYIIYGPINTCAPSLPFVKGKHFFCASPSFLSRLFSAAAHPNCMRDQPNDTEDVISQRQREAHIHARAIYIVEKVIDVILVSCIALLAFFLM